MTKDQKSKILTASVIVLLCLIFAVGFVIGLNSVLAMEGSYPPNVIEDGIVAAPETQEDALNVLNDAVKKAVEGAPAIAAGRDFSVNGDTVETDGADRVADVLNYVIGDVGNSGSAVNDALLGGYTGGNADFGEGIKDIIRIPAIDANDVTGFTADYIYYHCPSCAVDDVEPHDNCELCGGDQPYQMKYRDEYNITLELDPSNEELLKNNFAPLTPEEALALFEGKFDGVFSVTDLGIEYTGLSVNFRVNRFSGELSGLSYKKTMLVKASSAFEGAYETLGNCNTSFVLEQTDSFNCTWPSLVLSADEMAIEPKGNDNLQATLTCSDPTVQTVTWTSSDENILTVDDEGYFKAGKQTGYADVTATFTYNGKTYSDTCRVNVRVSVESMKMKTKKVKLSVGETAELKTQVSPKNATVQTVTWHSEDESIAKVDENGIVSAVASGTVTVYALSDDGYYKSSSEVTVK